jgi:erythromycin 3''-O-methyltransferase
MLGSVRKLGRIVRAIIARDPDLRVRLLYQLSDPRAQFADRATRYTNIGYWASEDTTVDEAGAAIATLLADTARLAAGQDVLDVGCGYGDQDFLWLRTKNPRTIRAVDVVPHQIERARRRAKEEGVAGRLDFQVGTATELPFEDGSFDRVVTLDAAMHFHTRATFFREAFRVLRPGGVLATVDTLPLDAAKPRKLFRTARFSLYRFSIPDANWYDRYTYADELAGAGFAGGHISSIREHTWEPWFRHWSRLAKEQHTRRDLAPELATEVATMWHDCDRIKRELDLLDYVLAVTAKPR